MLPLLKLANDGQEHFLRDAVEQLADQFNLNEAERKELLPSGQQAVFVNSVGWARTFLKQAGLMETTDGPIFGSWTAAVAFSPPIQIDRREVSERFPNS